MKRMRSFAILIILYFRNLYYKFTVDFELEGGGGVEGYEFGYLSAVVTFSVTYLFIFFITLCVICFMHIITDRFDLI